MFGFLKDKLKSVVDKFTKKVEEEGKEEIVEVKTLENENSRGAEKQSFSRKPVKEALKSEKKYEPKKEIQHKEEKKAEQKKEQLKKHHKEEKHEHKKEHKKEHEPKVHLIHEEKLEQEEKEEIRDEDILEEREIPEEIEEKSEEPIKKGFFSKFFGKKEAKEEKVEQIKEAFEQKEIKEEQTIEITEETKEKKGFFASITEKITTKKINEGQFNELFWDLELALLESNVAVEVIEKIKTDLSKKLVDQPLKKSQINEITINSLRESIEALFDIEQIDILEKAKHKKPLVICFVGINGSGKTTTISKIARYFQKNKLSVVMAAADTFRAAAIQQLEEHANNLNVKLIKHDYGADAAAVAFDAIKHAEARHLDVVLIDTAGRLHSNEDLMKEMQKLIRVAKPDLKLFIGESITGNDCVEQAKKFNEAIGIDGIILAKADIDDKGGAAISISYVTKKPILFLGTGQKIDDLKPFNKEEIIKSLGL